MKHAAIRLSGEEASVETINIKWSAQLPPNLRANLVQSLRDLAEVIERKGT